MATYKITNITNLMGKRDSQFNMALDIEYIDDREKKVVNLKPGADVFLTVNSLPLSVHRLRIKKLIDVIEVSPIELAKSMETPKPVVVKKNTVVTKPTIEKPKSVVPPTPKKTTTPKKKTTE